MRSFVALSLTDPVREAVEAEIGRLRSLSRAVAWVPAANLHLTLRFLGDQTAERLQDVARALADTAAASMPFSMALGGLGAFPSLDRPRILWVGVTEGAAEARALQARVEVALETCGFGREARAWHPHLTVGRILDERRWRGAGSALGDAIASAAGRRLGVVPVRAVSLMRSDLSRAGARYREIGSIPIGGPAAPDR
jgi:RNA 2',3'-cyclic 3'-phosphodiesterase